MPSATVRANARPISEAARKPIAALTDARSPQQRAASGLVAAVDELHDIQALTQAAQMAARDVEDEPARLPLTVLLQVILDRLEITSEKIDAARPRKEHSNV